MLKCILTEQNEHIQKLKKEINRDAKLKFDKITKFKLFDHYI